MSLAEVEDLLSRPARAALAYAGSDGPECVPVTVRKDGGIHVGVRPDALPPTGVPERVVLVVDDGAYWFELRAAVWRGTVAAEDGDSGDRSGDERLVWLRFEPRRIAAWDYGRLREEPAG